MGNNSSSQTTYTEGFHVLKVHPGSPGEEAGLTSYFDFIVAAEGVPLIQEEKKLVNILSNNIGKPVQLYVYNSKTDSVRETTIVPSKDWGGNGLIGVSIRFCPLKSANEHVWHVLDVYPDSPAKVAGLEPHTDYIVGTPDLIFNDSEDFYNLINSNLEKEISLYVYSFNTDDIRLIKIVPNKYWGGSGSLGCDVGYGLLHRIPTKRQPEDAIPPQKSARSKPVSQTPDLTTEQSVTKTETSPETPQQNAAPTSQQPVVVAPSTGTTSQQLHQQLAELRLQQQKLQEQLKNQQQRQKQTGVTSSPVNQPSSPTQTQTETQTQTQSQTPASPVTAAPPSNSVTASASTEISSADSTATNNAAPPNVSVATTQPLTTPTSLNSLRQQLEQLRQAQQQALQPLK